MNEKVLIEVYIPAISEKYDVWLPDFIEISVITQLLSESVKVLSRDRFISSGAECLCLWGKSLLLHPDKTLKEYDIRNGDRLILI